MNNNHPITMKFQFTHPVRGATPVDAYGGLDELCFNSRTPCGVRPGCGRQAARDEPFQFTHPVRGATSSEGGVHGQRIVSIHAPRAGCDLSTSSPSLGWECFNSRTPCGVRPVPVEYRDITQVFQFTHPVRGATVWCKVAYYGADKQV